MSPDDNFTRFAFSDTVKDLQSRYGSRSSYARMENSGDRYLLTEREQEFIRTRDSFYLATVNPNGWPYVQFRGGPPGFLRILDERTLAFADFRGNRQFVSSGNILDTGKASLILVDYPSQQRLKIWAEAHLLFPDDDPELFARLPIAGYQAIVERAIVFTIRAYDWNCPQHIKPRYRPDELTPELCEQNEDLRRSCCPDEIARD